MKKIILAAALAVSGLALPAHASDKIDEATQAKITEQLTAQGYEVRKIDSEDGMIEVYALKDGKKFELYLNEALEIVKSKEES
ncbi:PepSY domain-containing protein [Albidovulum sediminis]|uniref:PepSY domain-containing protein n=1 Tax=Albidovulum sediminis TaxID=3066345 RepID=A0ABT2NJD4_9RHOB|nr:PepSY domain-containing protein [Defluviimonas sediminis]MCT8328861.1 PepSY domain-containing protein [Defluviimonas sediminis]